MRKELIDKHSGAILFKKDKDSKDIERLQVRVEELEKYIIELEKRISRIERSK